MKKLSYIYRKFFKHKEQLGRKWYEKLKGWEQKLVRSEIENGLLGKKKKNNKKWAGDRL